jgi:tRNA wybutosine-synthesizing protein 1
MLRGRGGCYKHTFYNISSFQCMEMTPSLACSSKCVFCWRHHTNPVAKSFQWEHDPPQFLVEGGISRHQQMIRAMRGVPGVIPARLEEAMTVKHCALSLVGEPIMYPEINKFLSLLHERHISSFLVTNAQFPEQMEQLVPVTQLYLSIDASTPEDLKKIDRPLHEDYWERMIACIKDLARKPFRTVFRLTLVEGYNTTHLKEYTDLIRLGNPHFVEVKGVTFCGAGGASDLTMQNVPYHHQVVAFCRGLCDLLPGYEIACEHEHSCCMLIAKTSFKVDGKWKTWIDYKKFFELVESGRTDFTALEYAMETPEWAVFDSKEHGFDPHEVRHKKGVPITGAGC